MWRKIAKKPQDLDSANNEGQGHLRPEGSIKASVPNDGTHNTVERLTKAFGGPVLHGFPGTVGSQSMSCTAV